MNAVQIFFMQDLKKILNDRIFNTEKEVVRIVEERFNDYQVFIYSETKL